MGLATTFSKALRGTACLPVSRQGTRRPVRHHKPLSSQQRMRRYALVRPLAGGALLLALLPFFVLCFYNQPYLDDFALATLARTRGLWASQAFLYEHLYGRFAASLLLTAGNPLTYGAPRAFGLASLALLLLTYGSLWFGLHSLLRQALSQVAKLLLAGGLLLFFIAIIPDIQASFYWFAAQVTHQLAGLWLLVVPVSVARGQQAATGPARLRWLGLAVAGTLLIGGSSELVALLLGWLLLVACALSVRRRQGRAAGIWAGLLVVLAGAALLDVTAPGTLLRLRQAAPGTAGVAARLAQAWHTAWLAGALRRLLVAPGVLLLLALPLVLRPLAPALAAGRPPGLRLPLLLSVSVLLGGVLLGACLMQLQIESPAISSRCANVLLWWLLLGWLVACWAALPAAVVPCRRPAAAAIRYLISGALLVYVAAPVGRAWREALVEAPRWSAQWQQRYATLRHLAATTPHVLVQLPPIRQVVPRYVLVRGYDIATEYNRPYNRDLAAYFGVDSVRVDPRARGAAF